jgi:leader peptidase (prepilin peptidase)/N-methyltransferase
MGLGDVKLVIPMGFILGWPHAIVSLYLSFIIGAIVGVVLIFSHKASFGRPIAFGPFLIFSFFIVLLWGDILSKLLVPFFS